MKSLQLRLGVGLFISLFSVIYHFMVADQQFNSRAGGRIGCGTSGA